MTTGTGSNHLKELEDMFRSSEKVLVEKLKSMKLNEKKY